jgi:hypothetical protein
LVITTVTVTVTVIVKITVTVTVTVTATAKVAATVTVAGGVPRCLPNMALEIAHAAAPAQKGCFSCSS